MKYIKPFNESLDLKEIDDYFLEIYDEFPDVKIKQVDKNRIIIDLGIYSISTDNITDPSKLDEISNYHRRLSIFWKGLKESMIRLEFDKNVSVRMHPSLDYKYPIVSLIIFDDDTKSPDDNLFIEFDDTDYPTKFSINEDKLKSVLRYNGLTYVSCSVSKDDELWNIDIKIKEEINLNQVIIGSDIYNLFSKIDYFFDLFSFKSTITLRLGEEYTDNLEYIKK